MEPIQIFEKDSKEYKRLEAAAILIQAETGKTCEVGDTLYDAGQNWSWTTIRMESGFKFSPFIQILSPRQQGMLIYGSLKDWMDVVEEVITKHK